MKGGSSMPLPSATQHIHARAHAHTPQPVQLPAGASSHEAQRGWPSVARLFPATAPGLHRPRWQKTWN